VGQDKLPRPPGQGRVLVVHVRGGFESPMIQSQSAPLPSLGAVNSGRLKLALMDYLVLDR
jgi:hypothetical protein